MPSWTRATSYYYQYNQDGQVVRSRMVPGDLLNPRRRLGPTPGPARRAQRRKLFRHLPDRHAGHRHRADRHAERTSGTYPLSLWFESPSGVWFAEGTTTGTLQATLTLDEQGVWTIYVGVSGSASAQ